MQYHPESSPGPHDSRYLFDQFIESIKEAKKNAFLIFTKTKCDAVKIECNGKNYKI